MVEAWGGRVELGCWGKGLESREGVSWVVEGWVVWPSEWGLLGEVGSLRDGLWCARKAGKRGGHHCVGSAEKPW